MRPPSAPGDKRVRTARGVGLTLLGIALISGLLGFDVIPSAALFYAKMLFFTSATLSAAFLLAWLVLSQE